MVKLIAGEAKSRNARYGIIVSAFNEFITQRLLEGCLDELKKCGVKDKDITVVRVPGAFEIPLVAEKLARRKNIHAVICLGAVIRGETIHFDIVAENAGRGILQAGLATGKPVILGVITTDTVKQAYARSSKKDHKGRDAARAAVEMVNTLRKI